MIMDQQANLHRLNLLGSRPKSFLGTIPGIRYESWVYPRKTESILYYYAQALQPLTFLEKQLGSPVNCREFYDFLSPSAILASAIRILLLQKLLYFVSRHGKTKGLWRLSKTKRRNWNVSQSFRIIFQLEMFTEATYRNEQSTARSGRSGSHGPSTTRQASVPVSPEKEHIWRLVYRPKISPLQYIRSIAAQDNLYER